MENTKDSNILDNTKKLSEACKVGSLEEVEEILGDEEVDINGVDRCDTPLASAVNNGHINIVRRLLEVPEMKLDIDDCRGNTALHYACDDNRVSIIRLLCQDSRCSPDIVNKKNRLGWTPLMVAVHGGHLDIVRILLEHPGIKLNITRNPGETALHYACDHNRVSIIKLLCQDSRCSPGVINKKDSDGATPLMRAVHEGNLDIVKELDIEGTDFFTKDWDGTTLIEMARRWHNEEVLEYLMERNKVDSLKVIATHNVARYVKKKADIETLEIPATVRLFLARYVDDDE